MCRGNLKKLSCKACTSIVCFEEKVSCSRSSSLKDKLCRRSRTRNWVDGGRLDFVVLLPD